MGRSERLVMGLVGIITMTLSFGASATAAEPITASSAPQLVTITIPDRAGEIPSKWLSYAGPPRANVLLPAGYDPSQRYPLLVLLHGLNSNYAWVAQSGLITDFDGLNAIVVMPEGGSGWYTDWWNDGERGGPAWESYFLNEVIPTIMAKYPILPQRQYHAIAGVSMGGLGAVYLAGRLPGFFGSVASLSGFVDPRFFSAITEPGMGLTALAPFKGDDNFDPVDGPPEGFYFAGHDPGLLTTNLKQTRVFESTGTGIPSNAGLSERAATAAVAEGSVAESLIIYPMNQIYHAALTAAGIDVTYQVHSGGHDIPDFSTEIKAMLGWGLFQPVAVNPAAWVNRTVATSGQLWDISYRFAQPPNQVVQFQQFGTMLSVSAAGAVLTITTGGGCVIHTVTPATISVPTQDCP
ncbi:MAG TPA: alpha/beta hydrolase-fold protein [Acidimicrobiales bacterium]|jgi:S-formylglutathione hydrolase FrmB